MGERGGVYLDAKTRGWERKCAAQKDAAKALAGGGSCFNGDAVDVVVRIWTHALHICCSTCIPKTSEGVA